MAILTTPDDYVEVRAALHVNVSANLLPDSIIGQDIYLGRTEAEILDRDPQAASRTGDDLAHLHRAAIYYLAALLCPAMEVMTSESIPGGGYRYQRPEVDWLKKRDILLGLYEDELAEVLLPSATAPKKPVFFATVSGHRGR